jgi:CPA1 family monovalent cation:H+ antiporter
LAAVYATVIFLLESVVFSVIGLQLPEHIRRLSGVDARWVLAALAIAATLVLVRVAWVFPLAALRRGHNDSGRGMWQVPAVISWAGARGVVPLAAALSIPLLDARGQPLAHRDLVLVLATAVIVISLVVQGFTLAPLVRLAGIAVPAADAEQEYVRTRRQIAEAGAGYLEQLADAEAVAPVVLDRVKRNLQARLEAEHERGDDSTGLAEAYRRVRRDVVAVQGAELARLHSQGVISDTTRRRIQRQLDLEDARLTDEP